MFNVIFNENNTKSVTIYLTQKQFINNLTKLIIKNGTTKSFVNKLFDTALKKLRRKT